MTSHVKSDLKKVNEKTVDSYADFSGLIKHAARCTLWLPEAKSLRQNKNKPLRYFTLPGKWAYDILFFEKEGIIQKDMRGFPDVRFCDNSPKSYSDAKRLLGNTIGKKENFEKLVLEDQKEFWDGFPYDIYNLDFCGTCFPDNQPPFSETFQAIKKIISKHASGNQYPFIIFLTMKALDSETNPQAKELLIQNIETNRTDANFTQQINALIPDTRTFANQNFVDFILISIPKIICHLSQSHCDVEIKARAKYFRQGGFYITKFVFKFTHRSRRTHSVNNENYINNVLNIVKLNNAITIDNTSITQDIRQSNLELVQYAEQLQQNQGGNQ